MMADVLQLVESGAMCKPSAVDHEKKVIKGVKLIGLKAPTKNRRYKESALKEAVKLYEGANVNVDHATKDAEFRKAADRFGWVENVEHRSGDGNYGDIHLNPKHPMTEQTLWWAENRPSAIGMSHVGEGRRVFEDGEEVIEAITRVRSVDFVSDPATTKGLFESEGEPEMDLKSLTVEQLRKERPDLLESVTADQKTAKEIADLREAQKALAEENAALKLAKDKAEKSTLATQIWEAAGLPKADFAEFAEDITALPNKDAMEKFVGKIKNVGQRMFPSTNGQIGARSIEQHLAETEFSDKRSAEEFAAALRR